MQRLEFDDLAITDGLIEIADTLAYPRVSFLDTYSTTVKDVGNKHHFAHWFDDLKKPSLGCVAWIGAESKQPSRSYRGILAAKFIILEAAVHTCRVVRSQDSKAYCATTDAVDFFETFSDYLARQDDDLPMYGGFEVPNLVKPIENFIEIRKGDLIGPSV